ncbi:FAD-dependent oxidoreductase [Cellulomonas sp. McL0617]|uniref:FAD-dependent oxidoreductase n=1 Tax=Cellulomonas sp. McL0617 TaxID=3415675 RepID=UPI003CEA0F3A
MSGFLGRATTYRVMTWTLGAILLSAILLALAGSISQDPLAIFLFAVVAVLVSVLTSRLCGALWRTRVHAESSVITGLILALLFWPQLNVTSFLTLAGAAVVASLSKFVLAVRARHVLNPAAAGALIGGLVAVPFGGFPAAWWVATPTLLPIVALAGLVVVLRTGRGLLVATAVLASLAVLVPRLLHAGASPVEAVTSPFQSYPIVFAACFMLTEPLTLPPRRRQQLVEAALVGALTFVPFTVGHLYNSPELALVVGNVLAFTVGQRRAVLLRVQGHRTVAPGVREVAFAPQNPMRFEAGQWIELHVPHADADSRGSRRVFSVARAPGGETDVAVAFRLSEQPSTFKAALSAVPEGTLVRVTAVGGDFLLPRDASVPLLLVAGGIGITPFVSHLAAVAGSDDRRDVVVVLLLNPGDPPAYPDVLVASGARVVVVSPTLADDLPTGWAHVPAPLLDPEVLRSHVPDLTTRVAYVSGSPGMVDATRRVLRGSGVRRIRTDAFSGY